MSVNSFTVLIACLGLLIAYRQWHAARRKFQLDLFDKRFAAISEIEEAAKRLLINFAKTYDTDLPRRLDLARAIEKAQLLFEEPATLQGLSEYRQVLIAIQEDHDIYQQLIVSLKAPIVARLYDDIHTRYISVDFLMRRETEVSRQFGISPLIENWIVYARALFVRARRVKLFSKFTEGRRWFYPMGLGGRR